MMIGLCRNAPKRMDGDPSARIATEEAKQSAAQRDTSIDINAPSSSRDSPAEGDAPGSAPAGVIPMWEFEPVMDPAPTDAASGEQPHTSRSALQDHAWGLLSLICLGVNYGTSLFCLNLSMHWSLQQAWSCNAVKAASFALCCG